MKAKQLLLILALTVAASTAAWGQAPPVAAYITAAGAQPDINFSGYDLTTAAGILQNATTLTLRGSWTYDDMENLKASLKPGGDLTGMNTALRTIDMTGASLSSVSFQDAFYDCQALQEVIFPQATYEAAVTFRNAFGNCLALTTVTNLDKFTQVTDFYGVFASCESLQTIMLPRGSKDRNGVNFANAFKDCTRLTAVINLDSFVTDDFSCAFSGCEALETVDLPKTRGKISFERAFNGCTKLTVLNYQDRLDGRDFRNIFANCEALQSITFPQKGYTGAVSFARAFYGCERLTSIANLDKYPQASSFEGAFGRCAALRDVSLPASPANTEDVSFLQAFTGCTALRSIAHLEKFTRVSSFYWAFRNCPNLTYVQLGAFPSGTGSGESPTADTFWNTNPNCLVYLPKNKTEADIPADWKGLAVNFIFVEEATTGIITIRTCTLRRDMALNGDAPFHCPEEVYAEGQSVSYTRDFGTEPSGMGGAAEGWETICLPFRPDEIVAVNAAGDSVRLQPFRGDGTYEGQGTPGVVPFWLRQLTPSGYGAADKIVNNIPYIIALPNNPAYDAKFNVTGKVTFRDSGDPADAERLLLRNYYFDKEIIATGADYTMRSTYDFVGASPSVYVVDAPGTAFVANGGEARPFRPYVTANDPQNAPARFVIGEEGGEPTAIEVAVLMGHAGNGADGADGLRVYGSNERGSLVVEAADVATVDVVAIDGRTVRSVSLHEGVNVVDGLAAGVYVVRGCKAVVR